MADVQVDRDRVLSRLVMRRAEQRDALEEQVALQEEVIEVQRARIAELETLVSEVADQGSKGVTT